MATCKVGGCFRSVYSRGYCKKHWKPLPKNKKKIQAKKANASEIQETAGVTPEEKAAALQALMQEKAEELANRAKNSYYGKLKRNDVLTFLKPAITSAQWKARFGDGKIEPEYGMPLYAPWHYVRPLKKANCFMSHQILFDVVSPQTSRRFVPSFCHQCWKVVVRPQSLAGLFALLNIQLEHPYIAKEMEYPCKCGIERRPTVFGGYGGYFYNNSFDEGKQCYLDVRKVVDETDRLGPETPVIYKRACTEYELAIGPSHLWEPPSQEQLDLEEAIANTIVCNAPQQPMPQHLIDNVHRNWIEFAFFIGDKTYLEYTGGIPLIRPYITYHDRDPWKDPPPEFDAVLSWEELQQRGFLQEKDTANWEPPPQMRHDMGG